MRLSRLTIPPLAAVLAATFALAAANADSVESILRAYDQTKDVVTVRVGGDLASLANGSVSYALQSLPKARPRKVSPFGMIKPSMANFYHGGFIAVRVGAVTTARVAPALSMGADATGAKLLVATWKLAKDTIEARFSLAPNSGALRVAVTSQATAKKRLPISVRLRVYPQSYNRKKHGKPRDNFVITSQGQRLSDGKSASYTKGVSWLYFGDAKYGGKGGGALVGVDPKTLGALKVWAGNYPAQTDLSFRPTHTARFLLMDLGGRSVKNPAIEVPPIAAREMKTFEKWAAK